MVHLIGRWEQIIEKIRTGGELPHRILQQLYADTFRQLWDLRRKPLVPRESFLLLQKVEEAAWWATTQVLSPANRMETGMQYLKEALVSGFYEDSFAVEFQFEKIVDGKLVPVRSGEETKWYRLDLEKGSLEDFVYYMEADLQGEYDGLQLIGE